MTNLEDEIVSRDEQIRLTELRLSHLQEELVELSQTNEEYRSKIANLSTQIDIKETENRRLKIQESWLGPDLQEIQKLNDELQEQKQELQTLIATQAEEIEKLNLQIEELRSELDRLNRGLDQEKRKQQTFQDHEPEFDYLKSLEIEEKINKIRWLKRKNPAHFLLSTNGKQNSFNFWRAN